MTISQQFTWKTWNTDCEDTLQDTVRGCSKFSKCSIIPWSLIPKLSFLKRNREPGGETVDFTTSLFICFPLGTLHFGAVISREPCAHVKLYIWIYHSKSSKAPQKGPKTKAALS